ncbi:MAG TPA: choice-of-anchor tandem repeat GloVer-containing protein [Fimbriimonadaceae bacterium]|jgi:hypothetical protein
MKNALKFQLKPQYLLLAALFLAAGSFQALSFGLKKSAGNLRHIALAQAGSITDDSNFFNYLDLHDFLTGNVNEPSGVTIDSEGNIYGTTVSATGNVWEITKTGQYKDLHDFGGTITNADGQQGPDGESPAGPVTLDSDGNLYGMATMGGANTSFFNGSGGGMVFEITKSGQYLDLHDFGGTITNANGKSGPDGGWPASSYVSFDSAGNMYGVTSLGGAYYVAPHTGWQPSIGVSGMAWELTTDGNYIDLHDFGSGTDGTGPAGNIVFDGNGNMFGTASGGGTNTTPNNGEGGGLLWEITAQSQYVDVHEFGAGDDGFGPGPLTIDEAGNIYGTAEGGGANGSAGGMIFEITNTDRYLDLHDFGAGDDGTSPSGGPTFDSAGNMYGTTANGGPTGGGIAWELTADGQYLDLHDFVEDDPSGSIAFDSAGDMYGTTANGGQYHSGLVYKLSYLSLTLSPTAVVGGPGVTPPPATVTGGVPYVGAVALLAPALSDVSISVSSSSADAIVPSSVTIPKGLLAASFRISTKAVNGPVAVIVSAKLDGLTSQQTLTITPAQLTGIKVAPISVQGGNNSALAVYLNGQAGSAGSAVKLTSSSTAATVPATITVSQGTTDANVAVHTVPVSSPTLVTFTATFGAATLQATLTVNPAALTGIKVAPTSVQGGNNSALAVYLNGLAGSAGDVVKLSSNSSAATVPSTITVSQGTTDANVVVHTAAVSSPTLVTFTATFGSATLHSTLTVTPATLSVLKLAQAAVVGGDPTSLAVYLTGPAGPVGTAVGLSSSSSAAVVAASVSVPASGEAASVTVHTLAVSSATPVTLTATLGSATAHITLTVNPAALVSVKLVPTTVVGGNNAAFAVYLNGPAGPGGTVVTLTSSSSNATLPSSVTVPQGATAANVQVRTLAVISAKQVTLTAKLGSATVQTTLTINP